MLSSIFFLIKVRKHCCRVCCISSRSCLKTVFALSSFLLLSFLFFSSSLKAEKITLISFEDDLSSFTTQKSVKVLLYKDSKKVFDFDDSDSFPLSISPEIPVSRYLFSQKTIPLSLSSNYFVKYPDSYKDFLENIPYFIENLPTDSSVLKLLGSSSSLVKVYTIRTDEDSRVRRSLAKLFHSDMNESSKHPDVISLFDKRLDAPTLNAEVDFFDIDQRTIEMIKQFVYDLSRVRLKQKDLVVASTQPKGSDTLQYEKKHIITITAASLDFMEKIRSSLIPIVQSGLYPVKFVFLKTQKSNSKEQLFIMEESGFLRTATLQEYKEIGLEPPASCKDVFKKT